MAGPIPDEYKAMHERFRTIQSRLRMTEQLAMDALVNGRIKQALSIADTWEQLEAERREVGRDLNKARHKRREFLKAQRANTT